MEDCPDCGFAYDEATFEPGDVVRSIGPVVDALRTRDLDVLRHRRSPDEWSVLEYASHLRDVLIAQRERVLLAVIEDVPRYVPIHREERVVIERQNEQHPLEVAEQLTHAAALFERTFAQLDDAQRARTGIYNYPAPQERTVAWIAVHTVHECRHHTRDVERLLASS